MKKICPVCGFPDLHKPPYSIGGSGSYEICLCCGFQFGVSDYDAGFNHEEWRKQWVKEGMPWDKLNGSNPPKGWDPKRQLLNVTKG